MRHIGQLQREEEAIVLRDYLYTKGIECEYELDDNGQAAIWVIDEDHYTTAENDLIRFASNPLEEEFTSSASAGKEARQKAQRDQQKKSRAADFRVLRTKTRNTNPVTMTLIIASVGLFLLGWLGLEKAILNELLISQYMPLSTSQWWNSLVEIRHGQIWRMVTPIFIHFGFFHILFNMMWMFDLGSSIERKKGSLFLLVFVLGVAIPSNLAQYAMSGPMFGGMSGVVYAMLGYVWMKGRYAPQEGLFLHPNTVIMMIVWLFLGMFGIIGHMANVVHTVGLAIGLLWGYTSTRRLG